MARLIHVTKEDLQYAWGNHWHPSCENSKERRHTAIRVALRVALRDVVIKETNFTNVTVIKSASLEFYHIFLRRDDHSLRPDYSFRVPITWHMRRLKSFSFVITGFPKRITKNG